MVTERRFLGFLDKLKDFVKPNLPNNLSNGDLLHHFSATISGLVEARREEMKNCLDETDVKLAELSGDYSLVAAIDQFSRNFNEIIKGQVEKWLAADEALR